jgi:hypothetical protein
VRLVLFTTEPMSLSEANAMLSEAGFIRVMRLDEVRQVPSISAGDGQDGLQGAPRDAGRDTRHRVGRSVVEPDAGVCSCPPRTSPDRQNPKDIPRGECTRPAHRANQASI